MARDDRMQMPFRLPAKQMERLTEAAEYRGQRRQAFVEAAVWAAVLDVEEEKRLKKKPFSATDGGRQASRQGPDPSEPQGLGLAALFQQQSQPSSLTLPPPPPQAPVVVQVGTGDSTSATSPNNDIERLALYVVRGDAFMQNTRMRTAVEIFAATSSTDEERKVLVARLEEAVAVKVRAAQPAVFGGSAIKVARYAFDQLNELLGRKNEE